MLFLIKKTQNTYFYPNLSIKNSVYEFYMTGMAKVLGKKRSMAFKERPARATKPGVGCLDSDSSSSEDDDVEMEEQK